MKVYEGTVRSVTLDLLLYRLATDFFFDMWPYGARLYEVKNVEFEDDTGKKYRLVSAGYKEAEVSPNVPTYLDNGPNWASRKYLIRHVQQPRSLWTGTIKQFPVKPVYSAWWNFTGENGGAEGVLHFDQWRANEAMLYGYTFSWTSEIFTVFDDLSVWLSEHYHHDVRRLDLTPEQERQIESAGSDDERLRIVKEAGYTYWKDIIQQAENSGNVRQYLNERDISRTSYYRAKRRYRL